jgi:hypothetical protein
MDHNQQGGQPRRHFHRGRRGPDRRGNERRQPPPAEQAPRGGGDHVDVEQIMRDIRARISQRHGIELSNQQIQELAARRLEAILDPRTVKPALLDQLRKSAGQPPRVDAEQPATPPYTFEADTLFESHRGAMRFIRALLKPILKLFFNPNPLIHALNTQARLNADAARRAAEADRHQAEWNALHYELLQRVVTEASRSSLETQALLQRVESLSAKVDFNDRRVRNIEGAAQPPQRGSRHAEPPRTVDPQPAAPAPIAAAPEAPPATSPPAAAEGAVSSPDGPKRRRRRRRGRRGGTGFGEPVAGGANVTAGTEENGDLEDSADGDEEVGEGPGSEAPSLATSDPAGSEAPSDREIGAAEPLPAATRDEPIDG